jgi:hypothetical protein
MDMAILVKQHVVWLDVTVHDALGMYVSQRTSQLRYPEAHCIFREGLARNVEAQISARHEVHDQVPASGQSDSPLPGMCLNVQVFGILKAVAEIA